MSKASFEKSLENVKTALEKTKTKTVILDHHILRDIHYKEKMKSVFELAAKLHKRLLTAAEYYGLENFFLEAWRKQIYEGKRKVDVDAYYRKLYTKIRV